MSLPHFKQIFQQRSIQIPLLVFLLSRLWIAVFVYLGHTQHEYLEPIPGGFEGVANWWLNPWTTFDSKYFLDIAQHGYDARNAAFFPLYPFLLSLTGSNPVAMAAWGVFISNVAFLSALVVFYRLTQREYSASVADTATWLLAFFPTAAIFSAVYTESVFLFLSIAAFWFFRQRRWLWAAFFFFLAALTRNIGPVLFAALLLEWLWRRKESAGRERWLALLPVGAPALGFLAVQLYLQRETGIWMASVAGQQHFGAGSRAAGWPWMPLLHDLQLLLSPSGFHLLTLLNIAACVLAFVLLFRHGKKQPLSYSVWLLGVVMLHLTYTTGRDTKTVDALRYLSATFPFLQLLACNLQFFTVNRARLATGLLLLLLITAVMSYSFGLKSYVS